MKGDPRPTVLLAFAACVVLIGLNFVAVRRSNVELDPTWGAALRFGVAALLLMAAMVALRIPLPRGRALAGAALFGTLMFAVFFGFIYWGMVEVPAATGSIMNAAAPLLTFLVAATVGLERFRWSALAGAITVIAGIIVLVGVASTTGASPLRFAAVGIAVVSASVGTVVVKGFPRNHPLATNAIGMAVAFVLLLAASALQRDTWALPEQTGTWLAVSYLVASSLLLFPTIVWVIGEWTASASAYALVLAPLVTVPVGALLLGEEVGVRFAVAAAIIVVGVYVGALWRPSGRSV